MTALLAVFLLIATVYIAYVNRRQARMQDRYHQKIDALITLLETGRGHDTEEEPAAGEAGSESAWRNRQRGLGERLGQEERRADS